MSRRKQLKPQHVNSNEDKSTTPLLNIEKLSHSNISEEPVLQALLNEEDSLSQQDKFGVTSENDAVSYTDAAEKLHPNSPINGHIPATLDSKGKVDLNHKPVDLIENIITNEHRTECLTMSIPQIVVDREVNGKLTVSDSSHNCKDTSIVREKEMDVEDTKNIRNTDCCEVIREPDEIENNMPPGEEISSKRESALTDDEVAPTQTQNADAMTATMAEKYVVKSDVIITNGGERCSPVENQKGHPNIDEEDEDQKGGSVLLESLNGTRIAMAQTFSNQEEANGEYSGPISSPGPEEDYSTDHQEIDEDIPESNLESNNYDENIDRNERHADKGDANKSVENLKKDILAAEAMAHAIQNMAAFARQQNRGDTEDAESVSQAKPEVSAIRNQVRMIQQQQAYQVQMLSFLQWQLTLVSGKPQESLSNASNSFDSKNSAIPPHLLMAAGLRPEVSNMAGGVLMPQMMAAMAMNSIQNGPMAEQANVGMTDLAKARIMMSMQQNSGPNSQALRGLFSRTLMDQESTTRAEQEQRYQLKDNMDPEEEDTKEAGRVSRDDANVVNSPEENSGGSTVEKIERVSKSDSGYDDDVRSASINNCNNNADDTTSSNDSQEDGELRESALNATAEEQRHRCRFCHKVFGSDSALQIHIRSHTGERPFKCNICGNRFTTKGNLKVHFLRHQAKYPHIPMNSQPVPEYLDTVPTPNGVPYGMSILPEKAVLERPRLHGNPSIHIRPHEATILGQRDATPAQQGINNLFLPPMNALHSAGGNPDSPPSNNSGSEMSLPNGGMMPNDMAAAIQAQLLHRRRAEFFESYWKGDESKISARRTDPTDMNDSKPTMSMLQAAMLPFLPGLAAQGQIENIPPHLRYFLPQHLQSMRGIQMAPFQGGNENHNNLTGRLLSGNEDRNPSSCHKRGDARRSDDMIMDDNGVGGEIDKASAALSHQRRLVAASSETSKLQRLVENIDRGHVLQKNECHICHRVLSCQSALKLHYRTHTGERPYKCDLCSRAFTTRGNLRTHYSSVHRQQMRTIPQGNAHLNQAPPTGSLPCPLCPMRFRQAEEFQHHMQIHALAQAQQQQQHSLGLPQLCENKRENSPSSAVDLSTKVDEFPDREDDNKLDYPNEISKDDDDHVMDDASSNGFHEEEESRDDMVDKKDEDDGDRSKQYEITQSPKENGVKNRPGSPMEEMHQRRSTDSFDSTKESSPINLSSPLEEESTNARSRAPYDFDRSKMPLSSLHANPLDSLAALSNLSASTLMSQHTGSGFDHQLAALNRVRAGRLTVCEICEKPFSCQSALEIHLRTHTNERPFICKICPRTFSTKGNLKQHLLTHNIVDIPDDMLEPVPSPNDMNSASNSPSSSPNPCSSGPSGVKRLHDGMDMSAPASKRSYPRHWCHICQKQFSSASSLQIHNRTHTGEKPFGCSVCGRAFTTKGNLKVHMGTHVWGAGGSRRGRRISMDNPLISPWMKNMRPRASQPAAILPNPGHVTDPTALYQQYAAIANGLLNAKQDVPRLIMPLSNGHPVNGHNSAPSPASSSGSPLPANEVTSPQNRVHGTSLSSSAVNAATEWFLKAYQRTQEQVN